MLKYILASLAALSIAPALLLSPAVADAETQAESVATEATEEVVAQDAAPTEAGDIVSVAVAAGTFETLAAALTAADLVETLQGEGPFTVFAPTDEAFAALPEGTLESLLLPENKDTLVEILTYHVVSGAVTSGELESGEVETVAGLPVTVTVAEGSVMVNEASVITADIEASNGVIHVIDAVILPPTE
ncbi:MAG: fasciclin domain-containing protein [Synechococcaceae cyanobacterium SM2_3_60]|nr:fasciclin domain-containing protein [Synechococcaceae cyanobacterium SM2_3_60]